jgi:predicted ATP-binding protein involved in virulence
MRLDRIRLRNYRCFEDRTFALASHFNLVVGDNATGKTSLLSGASVSLGSLFLGFPEPAKPFSLEGDVARTCTFWNDGKPNIERQYPIEIVAEGKIGTEELSWGRELRREGRTTWAYSGRLKQLAEEMAAAVSANRPVTLPVLAYYGTGRVWKHKNLKRQETIAPGSRFVGYLNCLDPASDEKRLLEWFKTRELVGLQKRRPLADLEAVRHAIRTCVPDADRVYWDIEADQLAIQLGERVVWFRQLSDGYRNMLSMVADIAERCVTLNPALGKNAVAETPGVVLIDEIDLHLHPKWQRRVVNQLLETFPQIQFIATTHSPFVIQSLPPSDTVKLINLDDSEADDFANKSIEDITEVVQGVELPSRSERYRKMLQAAERYFVALERASVVGPAEVARRKAELDELALPFSDDPAYHALLKVERESRMGIAHASG